MIATNTPHTPAPEADAPGAPDLLQYIAEPEVPPARLSLPSGRVVEGRTDASGEASGEDRVTIRGVTGEVELEVRMTAAGPVLRFRSADLELSATRDVRVACDTFHVRAAKGIVEETGGDLRQRVGGDAEVKVRGKHTTLAAEARLSAKRGGVAIEASDDVELTGERVRLNC